MDCSQAYRHKLFCLFTTLLLSLFTASAVFAADFSLATLPNAHLADKHDYVSNPDNIINPQDKAAINQEARQLQEQLGVEVAIVAVNSIGENDAREFATDLFQHWGIGHKDKDNGLLILLVLKQRTIVFETGYGLEGVLPDAICYRLQQRYMVPDFKTDNFSAGMRKGMAAISEYLLASDLERQAMAEEPSSDSGLSPLLLIFLIILVLYLLRRQRGGGGRSGGGGASSRF